MPFLSARDLKQDVLFRASENQTGASGWEDKVIDYLNRCYKSLANGASEFLPEFIEDWWWMRARDAIVLEPLYNSGSISVTAGLDTATLDTPPIYSLEGYKLRVREQADMAIVTSHAASGTAVTFDKVWTGDTAALAGFEAMKVEYSLNAAVNSMISQMHSYRRRPVMGLTPERMDDLFPLSSLGAGVPSAFCLEDERTVRFNAGGPDDGSRIRLEYHYRPAVVDLTDSVSSIPMVPEQYRHLLSDMALSMLLVDKNDDRAAMAASSAKAGLVAMVRENRRRLAKINSEVGTIRPRPGSFTDRTIIRTEHGVLAV